MQGYLLCPTQIYTQGTVFIKYSIQLDQTLDIFSGIYQVILKLA